MARVANQAYSLPATLNVAWLLVFWPCLLAHKQGITVLTKPWR